MSEPGEAMMGTATAGGPDRATKAADSGVACPLLEGIDLSGARGVLVQIAASKSTFKLAESPSSTTSSMNTIRRFSAVTPRTMRTSSSARLTTKAWVTSCA